ADVATAEAIALNNHPRIRAAKLYLQAADQTISATRKNTNPIISGTLTSSIGSSIKSSIGAKIEASIPIFSGGELRSKQRSAVNARQAKKYALDTAVSSTRYNLNSYYATWQAALAAIKASNAQIESARIAFEGVTEEAKLGSRTTLDVLDAEQELLSARLNLVSALRDEQVQAYKVLAEMGQLTASSLGLNIKLYDPTLDYNKIVIKSPLGKARIKLLEKLKNR
ncbi:MAG: TolC family protein, partial [Rhodobacterales bacterium]